MNATPNNHQQRSIDAIAAALKAQPGEITLQGAEILGQINATIQSPSQPFRITLANNGEIFDLAFYDATEENCEADGTTTQGRWIDMEPDSVIGGAIHTAVADARPPMPQAAEPSVQSLLTTLSDQLLDLRDGVSKKRYNVSAEEAYERSATLVRALRDGLLRGPEDTEDAPAVSAADQFAPAELRRMMGLSELPRVSADETLVEHLAQIYYLMNPELDHKHRIKAWTWCSYETRTGHTGNALRVLNAIINGDDPHGAPFARYPLTRQHVEAAEAAISTFQLKAAS